LLSNIVLDELDKELEKRGLHFARYADDCVIYVRSKRAGDRVMQSVSRFLIRKLRLTVNEAKSSVTRPWEAVVLSIVETCEHRMVEDLDCVGEINPMPTHILSVLFVIPFELHDDTVSTWCIYVKRSFW